MKTDYPELEGKEVVFNAGGISIPAIVAGVNYYVGISVVNKDCKDYQLICLSHKQQHKTSFSTPADYLEIFRSIVKMIKEGVIYNSVIWRSSYSKKLDSASALRGRMAKCPFNL